VTTSTPKNQLKVIAAMTLDKTQQINLTALAMSPILWF